MRLKESSGQIGALRVRTIAEEAHVHLLGRAHSVPKRGPKRGALRNTRAKQHGYCPKHWLRRVRVDDTMDAVVDGQAGSQAADSHAADERTHCAHLRVAVRVRRVGQLRALVNAVVQH